MGLHSIEMKVQGLAFSELLAIENPDQKTVLLIIDKFAKLFRTIITEFEDQYKRPPNPKELIWIAGVKLDEDPRRIVELLVKL
jgi:hypothetical protein